MSATRKWLAVDLGVSFASEEQLPGIDLILPDIRYLVEERKNLVGLVLTHAHEDHFGAIIDLWPRLKIPIYATPFTAALLAAKRASEPGAPDIPVKIVPLGGRFNAGPFDIELVSMAHSIPESNALIIRTPAGAVLHTGDWKIDPTPILGDVTDEKKLRALGEEGCLALIGDSTNAVREGRSPSEADVAQDHRRTDQERARPRRGDDLCLQRGAAARRCRRRARRRPRGGRGRPRHGAHRAGRARDRLSRRRAGIPSASTPTAICRRTKWWRCAPAARASRARRSRASPRTSIRK